MTGSKVSRKARSGISPSRDVLFVGGIPRCTTQSNLRAHLQDMVGAQIKKVRFVIDRATRSHRGYGFVRFSNEETASKVLEMAKEHGGLLYRGKVLNVGRSEQVGDSSSSEPEDEDDLSDLPELEDDIDMSDMSTCSAPVSMPVQQQPQQPQQQVLPAQAFFPAQATTPQQGYYQPFMVPFQCSYIVQPMAQRTLVFA
eukprot:TRINITY_DN24931_c0_g1_i1.p1 TRINITY_DN24931_c0_g1~~TRINITY_DN24931_c0_g1_i1.p1  ORF type:complete len:198 (+),score=81.64 TRINITY_DN24931_c0_g1_i1:63-656(+)